MPLHDWRKASGETFHSFHGAWAHLLMGVLNQSVLPEGYLARAEAYAGPYQTDVLTHELGSPPRGSLPSSRPHPCSGAHRHDHSSAVR